MFTPAACEGTTTLFEVDYRQAQHFREVDFVVLDHIAASLDFRNVENVVDHIQEMTAAVMDVIRVLDIAVCAERAEHLLPHDFRESDNGIKRCAQLMAHIGEEFRLGAVCKFGRFGRPAETRFRPAAFNRNAGEVCDADQILVVPGARFNGGGKI